MAASLFVEDGWREGGTVPLARFGSPIRHGHGRPRVPLNGDRFDVNGGLPPLRDLGFRLEREESRLRRKSRGTKDCGLPPRFPAPYCDNADPWYEGGVHDHGIVDPPIAGTVTPYRRIMEIATDGSFWKVPFKTGMAVVVRVGQEAEHPRRPDGGALAVPGCRTDARLLS